MATGNAISHCTLGTPRTRTRTDRALQRPSNHQPCESDSRASFMNISADLPLSPGLMEDTFKERKLLSFLFYQAVRDHKPVWMLEDMRNMETFHWEDSSQQRTYSPSEALLYAIVHDHRAYAQYLLNQFSDGALAMPGERFCCCAPSAPHLAMAVRYDRKDIMALILQVAHRMPALRSYMDRGGCNHMEDGKTPLHLACELSHSEAVVLLLGNGASPHAEDHNGMTPLDLTLEQLWTSKVNTRAKEMCLESLLMFMPRVQFKMKSALQKDPQCWSEVLGEETFNYLVGRNPGTLFLVAMQKSCLNCLHRNFHKVWINCLFQHL